MKFLSFMSHLSCPISQKGFTNVNWQAGLIKLTKRTLTTYLIVSTLFMGTGLIYLFGPWAKKTEAAWFNEDWGYRQRIDVTNAGSAQTNYQMQLTLNTSTLVTAGKLQSDCDDIRIVDSTGNIYSYWMESGEHGCNQTATYFWIKMSSIPTTGVVIYIYYGNPGATNTRVNGSLIFEFFDDFQGDLVDTDKWTGDTSNFTVSGGMLNLTSNSYRLNSATSFTGDYRVLTRTDTASVATNGNESIGFFATTGNNVGAHYETQYFTVTNGSYANLGFFNSAAQVIRQTIKVAGTTVTLSWDGEGTDFGSNSFTNTGGISGETVTIGKRYDNALTGQAMNMSWDYIAVAKTASTEPAAANASEEKAPQPAAYWRFDDGTGTTAKDSITSANNGTLNNMASPPTGSSGWQTEDNCIASKCLAFDGTDDYVGVESAAAKYGYSNYSVSLWYKSFATTADQKMVMRRASGGGNVNFALGFDATYHPTIFFYNSSTIYSAVSPDVGTTNSWTHLMGTWDGTNLKLYVNGVLKATSTPGATPSTGTMSTDIGRDPTDTAHRNYFRGILDDVKIYNYTRTAAQVQADFNARGNPQGAAGVLGASNNQTNALSNGLIGYYKMDEAAAATTDCSTGVFADSSGNGNNGKSCPNSNGGPLGGDAGKFGNGVALNGSTQYIDTSAQYNFTATDSFSVSSWVKTSSTTSGLNSIVDKGVGFQSSYGLLGQGNGSNMVAYFGLHDATPVQIFAQGTTVISNGAWHHLVGVRDKAAGKIYIYVDGKLDGTTTDTTHLAFNRGNNVLIGTRGNSPAQYFNGSVDETRIYNRALSGNEVSQLYNFAPGPVGYWKMDEGSWNGTSGEVKDASGNGDNGTASGGSSATTTTGKYGKAGSFDGSDDYVNITDNSLLDVVTPITISAWVNPTNLSAARGVVSKGATNCTDSCPYDLYIDTGGAINATRANSSPSYYWTKSTGTISAGVWSYITVVDTGSAIVYYINGVLTGTTVNLGSYLTATATSSDTRIGQRADGGTKMLGKIDDLKIYNYARTGGQIIEDMNAGHPAPGSPVGTALGKWRFDEGYGTVAHNEGSQGSALDGTLAASPTWNQAGKFGKALNVGTGYVTLPTQALSGSTTWTGWVNASTWSYPGNDVTIGAIFSKGSWGGDADGDFRVIILGSSLRVVINTSTSSYESVYAVSNLSTSRWYHIAGVYNEATTTLKLYVNGLEVDSDTTAGTFDNNSHTMAFGTYVGNLANTKFSGVFDEFKLYGQAMTPDQIKVDMNQGQSQVLGAAGNNLTYANGAANQEYCVPGDATSCAAPVGRWDFNEGSGSAANDSSGTGNDGTITGATYGPGKQGKALKFNGGTDTVTVANTISTKTVEFWVNPSSTTQNLIDLRTAATAASISVSSGTIAATGFTSPTIYVNGIVSSTLVANTWQHVTVTTGTAISASAIRFGRISSTSLTGKLDSIRFYDYARTPAQVAWDYNKGGPVGAWRMDECQGTTIHDDSGLSNTGTWNGSGGGTYTTPGTCTVSSASSAWFNGVAGKRNYSLAFDGTDDFIDVPSLPAYIGGNTNMSLSMWFNPASTLSNGGTQRYLFSDSSGSSTDDFLLSIGTDGKADFAVFNGSGYVQAFSTRASWTGGTWYHIVAVFSTTVGQTIYVNGLSDGTNGASTVRGGTAGTNARIGGWFNATSNDWQGKIDDVRVFNYALTLTQVQQVYNGGVLNFAPTTGAP